MTVVLSLLIGCGFPLREVAYARCEVHDAGCSIGRVESRDNGRFAERRLSRALREDEFRVCKLLEFDVEAVLCA